MSSTNLQRPKSGLTKRKILDIRVPSTNTLASVRATKSDDASQQASERPVAIKPKSGQNSPIENHKTFSESELKIRNLVEKAAEMEGEVKERDKFIEEKFKDIRNRINNSVGFLQKTKHQINNIKFLHQQDMLNMAKQLDFGSCLQNPTQSVEELNMQMEEIQRKLTTVRERTRLVKEAYARNHFNEDYETTVTTTVNTLDKIAKGNYDTNYDADSDK